MRKYIQSKNLKEVFDLSPDYFESRMGKEVFEGIHYVIPPTTSKTKHVVLWDFIETDNWIRGNNINPELEKLLERR